ncbi:MULTISPECIES: CotD family spore coat protein [Bacillaceae]|uniref:Spore coat protein CotD n=1 Tax=Bacillus mesophilum TaxID=1071718 RepID=A0A7V7RMQ0_9BACI|nr:MULTISPECIES: CotD family spore coat protein [Bacillaceae]KAB2333635.1 spore coat protein CotD [Bacillus mesophilum]
MHCGPKKTNVLPAVVHPTKCCVNNTFQNNVVPHIHPTHTTTVNHINYDHVHYFPQTQSTVNEVTNQQFVAGPGPVPGFGAAPGFGGPGPGFGAPGPGFGGPGPGFGTPGPGFGAPGFGFRK